MTLDDGFVKVANRAIVNLETVKDTRKEICGAAEPLEGIGGEADRLISSVVLARAVESLQTPAVGQKTVEIMELASRLAASMLIIGAENRRLKTPRELQSGDPVYEHLAGMRRQLGTAREALVELILSVGVGLQGNARDGWAIERRALVDANENVSDALGTDLRFFRQLQHKVDHQTGEHHPPPTPTKKKKKKESKAHDNDAGGSGSEAPGREGTADGGGGRARCGVWAIELVRV